ncbi:resolvase [Niallia circulans]|uniref:Resolvase n=2 Tax=Niallia TaxID=2837506 RepID=A0A0J1KFX5_NIACI|nr:MULTISPECIES: recombinase family protein [Bacillaceae]EOR21653.1 resolvase [Niallia nealsonii AAU1]SLL35203.1 resolvase domain-containing protein [Mycobacteroides abscessus subsp. abscessus]HEO8421375.1 recombinase family protein [Yersinia enterocolitica]KAB7670344.1 recombinase family protein [Bacillus sp. B1-b2]KLV15375.1 resolvase [Niallia circulans]
MLYGYARPTQEDLTCKKQITQLEAINCTSIILEDHSSAKKRIKLIELINSLSSEDKIVITKFFALADSTRHLLEIMEKVQKKNAFLQSLHENVDTSITKHYEFTGILNHLVEFQTDLISEKTKEGLFEAKKNGKAPGRPKKPDKNVKLAMSMYKSGKFSLAQIKEHTGISKTTLYRYLEK